MIRAGGEVRQQMRQAISTVAHPDLEIHWTRCPHGTFNAVIVPTLNAANIDCKLMMQLGKVEAFGPILLGMAHPIHVLQRRSSAVDIANLTALAVVDAQERLGRQE